MFYHNLPKIILKLLIKIALFADIEKAKEF